MSQSIENNKMDWISKIWFAWLFAAIVYLIWVNWSLNQKQKHLDQAKKELFEIVSETNKINTVKSEFEKWKLLWKLENVKSELVFLKNQWWDEYFVSQIQKVLDSEKALESKLK